LLFNSYEFIFAFLPVVLAVCFVCARTLGPGAAQIWLTAASLYFYASWNVQYLPLLLVSILFNYAVARVLVRTASDERRQVLLLSAVAINLALLGYYKYTNYFLDTLNTVAGTHYSFLELALPLGISFYTFQQLTLLVDISQGTIKSFRFRDFLLFVTFFPHLIAGPIVHHREMMPQFERADYRARWDNLAIGLTLFAVGLFKKAVLADGIATQVAPLFTSAAAGPSTFVFAWAAAIGFVLQMYFDFSGYSEMALGLARMVGIKLPMNFNSPLKATSIIQYWACWHITLTRFLTAYIYNPIAVALTRRRLGAGKPGLKGPATKPGAFIMLTAVPTITTMFLSGLWHGAGNHYLVFGLLHAVYLVINHAWRLFHHRFWADTASHDRIMKPLGLLLTFVAATVALTYFRADSVAIGSNIVGGMAGLHGISLPNVIAARLPGLGTALAHLGIRFENGSLPVLVTLYAWIACLLMLALIPPNILQIMLRWEPAITLPLPYLKDGKLAPFSGLFTGLEWQPTTRWAVGVAALSVFGILALSQVTEFLYWQF
jgi:D-alanyl-lipoteichoic acid acyltransferase DltB (MBOAT superfamily)